MNELIQLLNTTLQKPRKALKHSAESVPVPLPAPSLTADKKPLNITYVVKPSNEQRVPQQEFEVPLSAADPGQDIFGIEEPEHPPFGKCSSSLVSAFRQW
jgi:hypothetical protein